MIYFRGSLYVRHTRSGPWGLTLHNFHYKLCVLSSFFKARIESFIQDIIPGSINKHDNEICDWMLAIINCFLRVIKNSKGKKKGRIFFIRVLDEIAGLALTYPRVQQGTQSFVFQHRKLIFVGWFVWSNKCLDHALTVTLVCMLAGDA